MAIDEDKLNEFRGQVRRRPGRHHRGRQRGRRAPARACTTALADAARRHRRNWPRVPTPPSGTSTSGCAARRPAATSRYDGATYSLTEEQAFALTNPDGGLYAPGAFVLALGALQAEPRITEAFRTGAGVGWHEQDEDVFIGCEQFFRPGLRGEPDPELAARRSTAWWTSCAPARRSPTSAAVSARRACCWPASTRSPTVHGFDYHDGSIELARKRAADAGVTGDTSRSPSAQDFPGTGYDLVATFDCLHDMGDPLGAATHIRERARPGRHLADRRAVRR